MRAFILGGGQGSRTADPDHPKLLTEVAGSALLDLQLNELLSIDEVDRITLLLGHQASKIEEHLTIFLNANPTSKLIDYIIEAEPRGSAGMLRHVLNESGDGLCFVALGDILPRGGITEAFHLWRNSGKQEKNVILVHPNSHPHDSDSVKRIEATGLVKGIVSSREKTASERPNLSPVGFFFLQSEDVKFWPENGKLDLVRDVLQGLIRADRKVLAWDILRRSVDVGTPERLAPLQEVLQEVEMDLNWAVFIDRDDTLIADPTKSLGSITLTEGIVTFLSLLNTFGIPVVCISNQPAIAKGQSTFEQVDIQNQEIQKILSAEGVYIDQWHYCPHHPETGFVGEIPTLKIDCDCRKPKAGMISKVCLRHDIDAAQSVIIGDTFRDIQIEQDLALRIHFLPTGSCDIVSSHMCVRNFGQITDELAKYVKGSKKS